MDAGKLNGSVFIDLKKAFDTVDHKILLRKISSYGGTGNALQLLKSYLIDSGAPLLRKYGYPSMRENLVL